MNIQPLQQTPQQTITNLPRITLFKPMPLIKPEALAQIVDKLKPSTPHYLLSNIPTPMLAEELRKIGGNNVFNPEWQKLVTEMIRTAGGAGDSEKGYVAWSKHGGFIHFKNSTIPDELNRKYAEISLLSGIPIEDLKITNQYSEKHFAGKTEFSDKFMTAFQNFMQNPQAGFAVDGGGVMYRITQHQESGLPYFFKHKKQSWLGKTFGKMMKWLSPVLSVLNFVPGVNVFTKPLSMILQGANTALQYDHVKNIKNGLKG
jgi:hypothetical protein